MAFCARISATDVYARLIILDIGRYEMKRILNGLVIIGLLFGVIMIGFVLPLWAHIREMQQQSKETLEEIFVMDRCVTLEDIQSIVPPQYILPDWIERVYLGKVVIIYRRGSFKWESLNNIAVYRYLDSNCFRTWVLDDPGPAGSVPP